MPGGESKSEPWIQYLEWGILHARTREGVQIYEVNLKVRPTGILCVLKGSTVDRRVVAFVGAGKLKSLVFKLREVVESDTIQWRDDKYA